MTHNWNSWIEIRTTVIHAIAAPWQHYMQPQGPTNRPKFASNYWKWSVNIFNICIILWCVSKTFKSIIPHRLIYVEHTVTNLNLRPWHTEVCGVQVRMLIPCSVHLVHLASVIRPQPVLPLHLTCVPVTRPAATGVNAIKDTSAMDWTAQVRYSWRLLSKVCEKRV